MLWRKVPTRLTPLCEVCLTSADLALFHLGSKSNGQMDGLRAQALDKKPGQHIYLNKYLLVNALVTQSDVILRAIQ